MTGGNHRDSTLLERADAIAHTERATLVARTPRSAVAHERACAVLPAGVPANGQVFDPPLVAARAGGAVLHDLDGNEYLDQNMGYGALFVGHTHPTVTAAVHAQLDAGSIYLLPCEDNAVVAEALAARWGLPRWRFTTSGTESTMPAVRAARSFTGRPRVVKIEGAYHGQYDTMLASLKPSDAEAGPRTRPNTVPASAGVPDALLSLVDVVPFNDLDAVERALASRDVACVIVEPALQNVSIVLPADGYLAGLRDRCDATGTLLVFDEVKIGITAHWGGATSLYGVVPDLVCVSKSIGGGLPLGAVGGRVEVMDELRPGRVTQVGTFSGNPLSMAASRTTLLDVCTPEVTAATIARSHRLADGFAAAIDAHGLPGHVVRMGAKGCITWRPTPATDYRDTVDVARPVGRALWLWCANRGALFPPAGDTQWLLSVQHTDDHVATLTALVGDFCAALAG